MGNATTDRDFERPRAAPCDPFGTEEFEGNGRDEQYLNKSGSKLFDSVEQKILQLFEISN